MIVRKLTCANHDEYGHDGWLPNWLVKQGFDPVLGFGVSHDILEHMVDKIGGAEGEFMAFGAMCWNRGDSGWFHQNSPFASSIAYQLSGEFPEIFRRISFEEQTLNDPGRTYKLSEDYYGDWDKTLEEIAEAGIAAAKAEFEDYGESLEASLPQSIEEVKRRIVGWMRKGFRKANQYYRRYNLNACGVSYIFDQITKVVEANSKRMEIGEILTLRIDLRGCSVSGSKDFLYE